ncbi:hypothetical protein BKA93DRAFT_738227, partial [Sparassis latifolia]
FVNTLREIHIPQCIDAVSTQEKSYLLTTWVEGDCAADVWDDLTPLDKQRIAEDLRHQFGSMRLQTRCPNHRIICNASGGPIDDPRVPWVAQENLRTFSSCQQFAEEVPFIERNDVPIIFSHGDLLPKNIIFPESLSRWRLGHGTICIIDWEYTGWMPEYWDPLKATWLECEPDTEWSQIA